MNNLTKRGFDILVSLLGIILLSPFLAEGVWQGCLAYARDDQGRIYPFGPLNRLI